MLEEITLQIREKRELLNKAIEEEKSYSEIYRISVELDQLIVKYYQLEDKEQESEKRKVAAREMNNEFVQNEKIEKIKEQVNSNEKKNLDDDKITPIECVYFFIKYKKFHLELFQSIIKRLVFLILGVCIIPNAIIDVMQHGLTDNVVLWNLAFTAFTMLYNMNLLVVTIRLKSWKHIVALSLFVVSISSLRYCWIMSPLTVLFMFVIPLMVCDLIMIYAYQFEFFKNKRNLIISALVSAVAKIVASYFIGCFLKNFIVDAYTLNMIDNIFVFHQIIPILLSTLITSYLFTLYVKRANIIIKRYDLRIYDVVLKEKEKVKHEKIKKRTLVDY